MDSMLLEIFQGQVANQCEAVAVAETDLRVALSARDVSRTWIAVQNILGASANIAKLCWGTRGRKSVEREPLRASLGISEQSLLRAVVDMRNDYEHFDERLDHWWAEGSPSHLYVDRNLGPFDAIEIEGSTNPLDRFREFDPTSGQLRFWGADVDLSALLQEVADLRATAQQVENARWD